MGFFFQLHLLPPYSFHSHYIKGSVYLYDSYFKSCLVSKKEQAQDSNEPFLFTFSDTESKFKQPSPVSGHARGGGRYWNGVHRKSSIKERSDLVLNWRSEGPDKNNDWRNHDSPSSISRPHQERKNSWRDEKNSSNGSSSSSNNTQSSNKTKGNYSDQFPDKKQ